MRLLGFHLPPAVHSELTLGAQQYSVESLDFPVLIQFKPSTERVIYFGFPNSHLLVDNQPWNPVIINGDLFS